MKRHGILKLLLILTAIHVMRKEGTPMKIFLQKKFFGKTQKQIYLETCKNIIQDLRPQLNNSRELSRLVKEIEEILDSYHLPKDSSRYRIGLTKRQGRKFQRAYIEHDFDTCYEILKHPIIECF